ncbi:TPA: hypothetical protein HA265_02725 [Candidatus Woesearchaeota archaeon]|nr:hypothetical protein [Candidatus Woesearchaeota archaeon]
MVVKNKPSTSDSDKELLKYLDEAVKLEKSSMTFYSTARNKVSNFNMKALLNAFLTVEVEHLIAVTMVRDLVKSRHTAEAVREAKKFRHTTPANPFKDMVQWEKLTRSYGSDIFTLFKGAEDLETRAEEFYLGAAKNVKNPELKAFLKRFAADEARHRRFLQQHKEAVYNDGYWLGIDHVRLQT